MQTLRLEEILVRDKFENLNGVLKLLQDEITPIVRNYFVLSDDIVVRYRKGNGKYIFNVEIMAERVKPYGKHLWL